MIEHTYDTENYKNPCGIFETPEGLFTAYIKLGTVAGKKSGLAMNLVLRSTYKTKGRAAGSVIKKMQALNSIYNDLLMENLVPIFNKEGEEALSQLAKELGIDQKSLTGKVDN